MFNFTFSFDKEKFTIIVNDKQVSSDNLTELNNKTQFCWLYDDNENLKEVLAKRFNDLKEKVKFEKSRQFINDNKPYSIKGYIASTEKPAHLKIHGTGGDFKAGLHLYVNGRLRQEEIFKDIFSQRVVESYLYGEIHVDSFDEGDDIFTSSREGIIKSNLRYQNFLTELKNVQAQVLKDWDKWRKKLNLNQKNIVIPFNNLELGKQESIKKFLEKNEDDDWKKVFNTEFLASVLPKEDSIIKPNTEDKFFKKILISHNGKTKDGLGDKREADLIYKLLLKCGFTAEEIIYTSSNNEASSLPIKTNIHEHLRKFYVNDWYKKPTVFFVLSEEFDNSWFCSMEAGAAWVTSTDYDIIVLRNYTPKKPLNQDDHLYLSWDKLTTKDISVYKIFKGICETHDKKVLKEEEFNNMLQDLINELS